MTEINVEHPTMSAVDYAAEVFKRTNRADTAGQWERADAIRDAVAEEMGVDARAAARASINDGSRLGLPGSDLSAPSPFVLAIHRAQLAYVKAAVLLADSPEERKEVDVVRPPAR